MYIFQYLIAKLYFYTVSFVHMYLCTVCVYWYKDTVYFIYMYFKVYETIISQKRLYVIDK